MKKVMFAAMAALAITSCSQNEEMDAPSQKVEVGFNSVVGKATRATAMENANFADFKVYAYNTGETEIKDVTKLDTKVFMPGVSVTKPAAEWIIGGTYYWPLTDNIQFFAYSPEASTTVADYAATAQYPTFDYTVKAVADQEDLLAASATDRTKENAVDGVSLTFKHLLTQINFSAKGTTTGYTYTVSKIEITGVNSKSTFTFDGKETVGSWAVATTPVASYEYAGNYSVITGAVEAKFGTADNALMLMPQTLPTGAKIVVSYKVNNGSFDIFEGTGEVSIKDLVWAAGSKTRYTLTLKDNGSAVSFIPEVKPWEDEKEAPLAPEKP